ncbi:MAG: argininosuccinate lyase [Acidobacteriota bacterium]|nr:argininosuccinate lyase [Acidobacteriota bacterium]MDE3030297.1 argininosuccinate lyase [Acidobacteriota bacterium]
MDQTLWDLSESYSFDHVLYAHDIEGSLAHVAGLEAAGLLNAEEGATLSATLERIRSEFEEGTFERHANDEDVHMAIERRATELVGALGAKLHTARSRNDQVATTLRLFTRDALSALARQTLELATTLATVGERYPEAYLPGYTHLQRAQPVLLSHHLGAHAFSLARDVDRLLDARRRLNVSPLGAGALAGTSLPIDPARTAALLGFDEPFANSMDAVSDRDFVAESLFDIALLGVHLSRMGEELVLWTTSEFGFATLGDDFTTGSSMLPQKKNSDVAELARGKSGRLVGNLTGLLVTLKGLPLTYNRDLQEDKEPLFDSVRQVGLVLAAMHGAYSTMTFNVDVAARAADDQLLVAIDIAEQLVTGGMPFRQAHEVAGSLVGRAIREGRTLHDVASEESAVGDVGELFVRGAALASRRSPGGSGPLAAGAQRDRLRRLLADLGERL